MGRFIFDKEKEYLLAHGVHSIVYERVANKNHEHFIKVMGFIKQPIEEAYCYEKKLL